MTKIIKEEVHIYDYESFINNIINTRSIAIHSLKAVNEPKRGDKVTQNFNIDDLVYQGGQYLVLSHNNELKYEDFVIRECNHISNNEVYFTKFIKDQKYKLLIGALTYRASAKEVHETYLFSVDVNVKDNNIIINDTAKINLMILKRVPELAGITLNDLYNQNFSKYKAILESSNCTLDENKFYLSCNYEHHLKIKQLSLGQLGRLSLERECKKLSSDSSLYSLTEQEIVLLHNQNAEALVLTVACNMRKEARSNIGSNLNYYIKLLNNKCLLELKSAQYLILQLVRASNYYNDESVKIQLSQFVMDNDLYEYIS